MRWLLLMQNYIVIISLMLFAFLLRPMDASHIEYKIRQDACYVQLYPVYSEFQDYLTRVRQYIDTINRYSVGDEKNAQSFIDTSRKAFEFNYLSCLQFKKDRGLTMEAMAQAYSSDPACTINFMELEELQREYAVWTIMLNIADLVDTWALRKKIDLVFCDSFEWEVVADAPHSCLITRRRDVSCPLIIDMISRVNLSVYQIRCQLKDHQIDTILMGILCDKLLQLLKPVTDIFDEYSRLCDMADRCESVNMLGLLYLRLYRDLQKNNFCYPGLDMRVLGNRIHGLPISNDLKRRIEQSLGQQNAPFVQIYADDIEASASDMSKNNSSKK